MCVLKDKTSFKGNGMFDLSPQPQTPLEERGEQTNQMVWVRERKLPKCLQKYIIQYILLLYFCYNNGLHF